MAPARLSRIERTSSDRPWPPGSVKGSTASSALSIWLFKSSRVIAPDRGHEDQHFRHHHVNHGQEQQAAGKAMGGEPIGVGQSGAEAAKHGGIKPEERGKS